MSFPPRPPMGMAPMVTGTYYAPMGMVPMGMRMMAAPSPTMIRPVVNSQKQPKKLVPQEIPKDSKDEKPPVTTVFVGNISDKAPDVMIKQMLQRCGNVLSWKRVQGASGKLQAFGFCEYEDPEATLRCIRLLNDWYIPDKKLVVKVDAKTKTLLDDYRSKKKADATSAEEKKEKERKEEENGEKENGEIRDDDPSLDELDEFTKREDRVATAGLEAIMMEYSEEMNKAIAAAPKEEPKPQKIQMIKEGKDVKDVGLDGLEVEEETKFIINREIRSFRDLHKDEEVDEEKERREQERRNEDARRRRDRERERLREKEMSRRDDRREERIVDKRRNDRHSSTRSRSRTPPNRNRNYNRRNERERTRERSRTPDRSDRSRRKEQELEEEEEEKERRKLEKKLREKEAAYKERLTNWEGRERKKARENDKEREREEERKTDEIREARRLKEFLEDYDDLRDDPKFFKGSALSRRMKEREKEKEADARDRQREKEEFEEIKRRLMDEGHPDPEAELARIEKEREEHLKPRLQIEEVVISPASSPERKDSSDSDKGVMKKTMKPIPDAIPASTSNPVNLAPSPLSDDEDNTMYSLDNDIVSEDSQQPTYSNNKQEKSESSKHSFSGMKLGSGTSNTNSPAEVSAPSSKRKKLTVGDVFNQDEDSSESKKRKLVPLDYDEEKKPGNVAEEKRNKIKILIDSIPTAKEELFAFSLDWTIVDQALMDKRIKPWINKKIVEYIGEEEPTLTDFICQKVIARSTPASIQNDVAMVLDEEAEVFVVKMWRLLVYETEAKKLGLVK
ncbi:hypothetical protein LOTGIDRAFT_217154 [Lottia gigantea]|uniref:PWI domain-containing protein n=1 Tax=Lottia gigantea TaxID=225164 RepID=V4A5M0_LOTGI|nr:hypothetical protein LOTGIDRAFT_217154 [Lottia gigantea]ESO91992.1 hypothetical protein LOTGIDRAFT_217154 [Lottia gigantea]